MREKREWRTWLGRAPGRSFPVERRRPQRRAGGLQLFFFFGGVFWSGEGEGAPTDETLLRFHGVGEVRDGDAPAHGDVVKGLPCHEDVGDAKVGHLGGGEREPSNTTTGDMHHSPRHIPTWRGQWVTRSRRQSFSRPRRCSSACRPRRACSGCPLGRPKQTPWRFRAALRRP